MKVSALALAALFAAGVALGETRSMPVTAKFKDRTMNGELEILNGSFLVLVVGTERHPLQVWERENTELVARTLDNLASRAEDERYVAIPYELSDGHKNALVEKV